MTEAQRPALQTYRDRIDERRAVALELHGIERRLAWARLFVFVGGVTMLWPALTTDAPGLHWLLVPVGLFAATVLVHERSRRSRRRAERAVAFYERGLARVEDRWSEYGSGGERFRNAEHPYASDLDLFGRGSLFQLVSTARTVPGERALARWLEAPADPCEVRRRQAAVRELQPRLDLREDLWVLGGDAEKTVDPDGLMAWSLSPAVLAGRWPVVIAAVLAVLNVATFLAIPLTRFGLMPFLAAAALGSAFALVFRSRVQRVMHLAEQPERELELLAELLARIERERFEAPLLQDLRGELETGGEPASRRITRLARLVQVNDSRDNLIFRPFASMLLLGTQLAFAMERWRNSPGQAVPAWLEAVGGIEALASLASLAHERPSDTFPEIVEGQACFEGQGLGHPLLPASTCVRNDVRLADGLQLLLVSGSNMSGKSTLLRTVGVTAVLALAGAPVRAQRLRLSQLALGASMRIQDSLQDGVSHFYAEIKRLKQLVELGHGQPPLLFLLDDVLHGTNSHDRRLGAAALIRGLVEQGGIGLVTTHDLALAKIADDLKPHAANVHFVDRLEGDRMVFDYRLQSGVVQGSNAIALMRAVGLDV